MPSGPASKTTILFTRSFPEGLRIACAPTIGPRRSNGGRQRWLRLRRPREPLPHRPIGATWPRLSLAWSLEGGGPEARSRHDPSRCPDDWLPRTIAIPIRKRVRFRGSWRSSRSKCVLEKSHRVAGFHSRDLQQYRYFPFTTTFCTNPAASASHCSWVISPSWTQTRYFSFNGFSGVRSYSK